MGQNRNWTEEEVQLLQDMWGENTIETIAKRIGRSKMAIVQKAQKMKLGKFLESGDYVTLNQLSQTLAGTNFNSYRMKSWVKNRNFPLHYKRIDTKRVKIIRIEEFWKWAEKNRSILDFSKFPEYALGAEPAWVKEKRKEDSQSRIRMTPWTKAEDDRLRMLLSKQKYTYAELQELTGRTTGAIQRRCCDLGIMDRPVRQSPHNKWTEEQKKMLHEMIRSGRRYETIAAAVEKSTKAVRGYVYRIYGTENLDKIRTERRKPDGSSTEQTGSGKSIQSNRTDHEQQR